MYIYIFHCSFFFVVVVLIFAQFHFLVFTIFNLTYQLIQPFETKKYYSGKSLDLYTFIHMA